MFAENTFRGALSQTNLIILKNLVYFDTNMYITIPRVVSGLELLSVSYVNVVRSD